MPLLLKYVWGGAKIEVNIFSINISRCDNKRSPKKETNRDLLCTYELSKLLHWATAMKLQSGSWVAGYTLLLESNKAICSCQIIAAQHPGPLLPNYISQQAEPTSQIEPS